MSVGRKEHTLGLLQEAWDEGTLTGMEDRELLAQFAGRRDARAELAFAMLVRRHGPMVLGVCRRLLVDRHAADDAFQATFMVLARKASTLRRPDLLAGWLHSVALRTARCARVRDAGRGMATVSLAEAEESIPVRDRYDVPSRMIRREEAGLLHEEIGRLPEKYRLPLILCHFEGLTHEQAACRLRWPAGTLSVRLMRAKALLRTRLAGRGLAPGGLGDAMLLPALASRLALPPGLVEAAARAALAFVPPAGSAGSAPAVVLALAALRSLRVARWGAGLGLALAISVGVGAGPQGAKWGSPGDDLEIRAAALAAEITAGMPRSHRPQVPPIPPPGPSTVQEDVPEASPGFRWVQLPHFSTTPFLSSRPGALASSWQGESVATGPANGEVYSDLVEVEEGEWLITPGHASSDLDPRLRDYRPVIFDADRRRFFPRWIGGGQCMSEFGETASIHHYLLGRGRPGPDDIRAIGIERMTSEIRRLPRSARPVEDVRPAPLPVLPPECEGRAALALAPDAGRTWAITPRPLRHDRWSRCVSEPMGSVACHVVKARSGALHVYLAYRSRHPLGRLRSAGAIQASCPDTVLEYWPALFDRSGRRDRASMPHILSRVRGLLSRFGPSGDGDTSETAIYRFRLAPSPLPESMASQYPRTGPPEEAMHIPAGEVAFLGVERMTAHDYLIEQYNDYANMKILEGKPHGRREFSSQFYLLTPSPFGRSQHDQPSWVMTGGYDPTP